MPSAVFPTIAIIYLINLIIIMLCYEPSVISVTVTKGEHPRGGGLYGTSRTMGRGVNRVI